MPVGNDEKIYSTSSKVDRVMKTRHGETEVIQNPNSDTPPVTVSVPKVVYEAARGTAKNTGEGTHNAEHKTRSHGNKINKQQLMPSNSGRNSERSRPNARHKTCFQKTNT